MEDPKITLQRNFRRLVFKWCDQTGRPQADLWRAAGIKKNTHESYIAGRRLVTLDALRKYCEVMEIPVEVFFRR